MPEILIDDLVVPIAAFANRRPINPDHHLHAAIAAQVGADPAEVRAYRILRRSLDARGRRGPRYRYRLRANIGHETTDTIAADTDTDPDDPPLHPRAPRTPLIVGAGPAGLFAALYLARRGLAPILIDRGRDVDQRRADIAAFHDRRCLDPDSNYLYGEGGAGTWSDGKLYTRVRDPLARWVIDRLIEARAPANIAYLAHPHIGSDILPHVVRRIRQAIVAAGGTVRWRATVDDLLVHNNTCRGVVLADGERLSAPATLLAVGHSARALIVRLAERGVAHRAKGWQLGCRIEHPQALIDRALLGQCACPPLLGAAAYALVSRPPAPTPSASTFCMCPGGSILPATADPGQLCTNGGSDYRRRGRFANAALIVNQDHGGIAALNDIAARERAAFTAGGGDYTAPAQCAADFLRATPSTDLPNSSYTFGLHPGRLDKLLPPETAAALAAALRHFDRRLPGFIGEGVLVGLETRVSSPIRYERDPATMASSMAGLYVAGEGGGTAGGIMSAAIDGLRVARALCTVPKG